MTIREDVYTGKTIVDVLKSTVEYDGTTPEVTGRSSRAIWKSTINNSIKNSTLSPFVYKEVLRSIISSFSNLYYVDGEDKLVKIKSMHGNPERAVAKKFQENNIVLPVITVHQMSVQNDESKRRYDSVLIQNTTWNDEIQRAERIISLADVPVKITYSLNLWTKYLEDLDQISQNIRVKFNPSLDLVTRFTDNLKVFLSDETNDSASSVGDREDRLLRKSFSLETEFYIPSPRFKVTSTGRIEKIVSEIWVS